MIDLEEHSHSEDSGSSCMSKSSSSCSSDELEHNEGDITENHQHFIKKIQQRSMKAGLSHFSQFTMLKNLKVERALKNKLLLDHDKKLERKFKNGIKDMIKKQKAAVIFKK